jgi:preprotein translocase subunit SecA
VGEDAIRVGHRHVVPEPDLLVAANGPGIAGVRVDDDAWGIVTLDQQREELADRIGKMAEEYYQQRENMAVEAGADMREIERVILLRSVDRHWMDHIDDMDQLRQGVALRAYGQRDPAVEYKMEGYDMFENMVHSIQEDTVLMLLHLNVQSAPTRRSVVKEAQTNMDNADASQARSPIQKKGVVGRNDPCPCGSGKKYKNCCGKGA